MTSNNYTLLPFQFKRINRAETLIVNESGDFLFISNEDFHKFIRYELTDKDPSFFELKSHLFLATDDIDLSIRQTAARYVTKKAFLRDFTSLHMMVVTLCCNQRCEYCQVSCASEDAKKYDMTEETARKIVEIIFKSPIKHPKIEFQGGEPTLNWKVITTTVEYAEQLATEQNKSVDFVICTNLISINENKFQYCKEHNISISTSLDGPERLHDACRKTKVGQGTYQKFIKHLEIARSILGHDKVNALMTTTTVNLNNLNNVIDEYIRLGFNGIFIRSLNPYGFAAEKNKELGYEADFFVKKYLEALDYIVSLNNKVYFQEYFASLLLSRILTPFSTGFVDLQSPAGAGICGVIYDYDGSVFPSDEARMLARMGDRHFCLGNVHFNNYKQIFTGQKLKDITRNACVEITAPCAWCAYQAYCGCDPVRNYLETGSEVRNMANSSFCKKYKKIFNGLFDRLRNSDEYTKNVFWSWITNNPDLVKRNV